MVNALVARRGAVLAIVLGSVLAPFAAAAVVRPSRAAGSSPPSTVTPTRPSFPMPYDAGPKMVQQQADARAQLTVLAEHIARSMRARSADVARRDALTTHLERLRE